jgi:lipid II:glycine glycyltransferase (peptidoglycan interpeptide bridge formation enzyme)
VVRDGDEIAGGAQVLTRPLGPKNSFYYIPEGPVLPEDPSDAAMVFQMVMDSIDERRKREALTVCHLRIEPRWEALPRFVSGFRQRTGWNEPRTTLYIDLTPSEEDMLARMKPKGRYNVHLARRHGVSISEDASPQGVEDFLSIYEATVTRHGLDAKEPKYFRRLIPRLVAWQRGSVFFAEYRGERIAAVLVIYFGQRATYFFGGSLAAHRQVMAPYLLHFEIMRKAKALGCLWYDMYGIAPLSEPNHKWAKISAFKRKLGGTDVTFVPSMDYIYDPTAYEAYRQGRRRS